MAYVQDVRGQVHVSSEWHRNMNVLLHAAKADSQSVLREDKVVPLVHGGRVFFVD